MIDLPYLADVCRTTESKIVLLVVDGLGGVPHPDTGKSELETAHLPSFDRLAQRSAGGLTTPVMSGITPGSGPGHMALFGYDPVKYLMGRGVLEALGIDVALGAGDLAARGNLCTVDSNGNITDRRAGRIPTAESAPLVEMLNQIEVPGLEVEVLPVQDYRFVLVLRGEGLDDKISETDPQMTGIAPLEARALDNGSERAAAAVRAFIDAAKETLSGREYANMAMLRGFSLLPGLPDFGESYRLNPGAVAAYPMYRGIAKVVGMHVIPTGMSFDEELDTLEEHFDEHDFFFLHYKPSDSAGEDGDFQAKVKTLEALDACIDRLVAMQPDVLVVAGDHSTPALLAAHSWHPVPMMISSEWTIGENMESFDERACAQGSLGRIPATELMLLAMAHAGKLLKYGP
ncbi:MAG: 2,3-bisphosphoglycerate-independent phosphoglycerate mutase [Chloroflexota bacterium]|nr:2,3-bisphosphoglycerate-independent phosphoglycerate mutase [Chloroflexota bacterium]